MFGGSKTASESAWKARLEEKVVRECSGRGKVTMEVLRRGSWEGAGGARIAYSEVPSGSGIDFLATASRGPINLETRKPNPTAW